jgi:hypothetical protein
MNTHDTDDHKRGHKPEKDMPWRVAPRLKGVVKSLGVSKKNLKKKK